MQARKRKGALATFDVLLDPASAFSGGHDRRVYVKVVDAVGVHLVKLPSRQADSSVTARHLPLFGDVQWTADADEIRR